MLLVALSGTVPLAIITLCVISFSVNKDIGFGRQELRGNAFQKPLEQLLDLLPQYAYLAGQTAGGDASAREKVADVSQKIEAALAAVSLNYNGSLGQALKFNDAELAARQRNDARLAVVTGEWEHLKQEPLPTAAAGDRTAKLVNSVRMMIAHEGDLSNLILDTDLDSYYLVDVTLNALPQAQQRLAEITAQVSGWIRADAVATNKTALAVMVALMQENDVEHIQGDVTTSLNEDKNFYGISPALQSNLPPATKAYAEASQAVMDELNRLINGEKLTATDFEAAGWRAHAASYQLWQVGASELDTLLQIRVNHFCQQRFLSLAGMVLTLVLAAGVIGFIVRRLNRTLAHLAEQLEEGSEHVAASAKELAASSHSLAECASEQAASLEETSASLEEIASMARRNTEHVREVDELAKQASTAAERGVADMEIMEKAMAAVKTSSDQISKIIKTIDEIAFQTNILALNAAVEAARAGEAGMGFSVVADEVRNLAQRSAQAAKETGAMIEGAIRNSQQGAAVSTRVAAVLQEIEGKIKQVHGLASEVAGASGEQSTGISQLNEAVTQMDKATQGNAANAEEGAAASEELKSQSELIRMAVGELIQLVEGNSAQHDDSFADNKRVLKTAPARRMAQPAVSAKKTKTSPRLQEKDFANF